MGLNRKAAVAGAAKGLRPQGAARAGKAQSWELRLREAEKLLESRPAEAAPDLEPLVKAPAPPAIRAQALALLAFREAALGSAAGLASAEERLARAVALKVSSPVARGRVAHARGYLAYKRGEHALVVSELNKAASLYPAGDARRAHVFDTLGMQFENGVGDLERARSYYLLSIDLKRKAAEEHGLESQRNGLALTYGNLGRLELARERHCEAERYFREDLDLILAAEPRPTSEAHVRNQLARALYAQGPDRAGEAREELDRALAVVTTDSVAHAYILKDLARVRLTQGDAARARAHVEQAREIAERMGYREVLLWVAVAQGELCATQAERAGDDGYMHAMSAFDEALAGFERMHMPREICDVALLKADLMERLGKKDEALRILRDLALPLAERHLFAQLQPLSRIETRIGALSPETLHETRGRRMLGGVSKERYNARLRGERHRLTVWTCDIRGFTRYCTETRDPLLVVDMLNRFFAALGAPILDHGGRIDKYVGDNILAYFRDPATAAHMALWALWAMDQLNTEREHLAEQRLEIGIGLSTGEVVEGTVGFAGKLEHTIIGTPVNTACRLVSEADPGQILIDVATRNALGDEFLCMRAGRETISLKGLGEVQVFELKGTKDAAPMSRRGDSRWAVR